MIWYPPNATARSYKHNDIATDTAAYFVTTVSCSIEQQGQTVSVNMNVPIALYTLLVATLTLTLTYHHDFNPVRVVVTGHTHAKTKNACQLVQQIKWKRTRPTAVPVLLTVMIHIDTVNAGDLEDEADCHQSEVKNHRQHREQQQRPASSDVHHRHLHQHHCPCHT